MYQAALAEHGEAYTKKEKANAEVLREILNKNKQVKEYLGNPELTLKKGNYSKIKPNREDKVDINKEHCQVIEIFLFVMMKLYFLKK